MAKKVVVSGLKPSGELHIGNYLGAIKQLVELQNKSDYKRFYFIADYHALTQNFNAKDKSKEIFNMVVDSLATGIDPKKSVFFVQSHISAHNNLAWIFDTITSTGELSRMTAFKEKVAEGHVPNAGLYAYPVLMAADVLIYNADFVPVGDDQRQHVELTRTIARTFNARFGKMFKEPKTLNTETSRIMSLSDPTHKMSKSISSGCLFLSDSPDTIKKKIMSAQTDSERTIGFDPKRRPAVSNLVSIYAAFANTSPQKVVKKFEGKGYADFKKDLATLLIGKLKPIQKKRAELLKDRKKVMKILESGAKTARPIAEKTLDEAKRKVGLI
ncbi:MAG: Tryptophan-tRNA ligase [Parcubacteria group bacterium GW2011_GWB1_45_7]|uniref:Tryptophan--tRNA ligase n=2 Tax=Candidatus Colwelliibacteriota TaxID=1817904 RepID=A0A1G1ZBT0_9BACT|nr:MAG: Tryptophan-tRNA ligase [Parcubacteria group bacterium GW2011_GWB1_45_7]OGY57412.1 MAG: tryptophan--tRNA ligase [Candidatus Colwellbacteria bacterium RIFCSPHIGHO2_02_FULL_45_17]OGY60799.1 MAG: tryptophan--tRNA ligase [Candidatus Colwellbacteria bacterium RIFCSPLOWO2_02_FULL_45_11]OGY62085.1 MAG: tryptophan--tRNA ligase [Candidatus Colwellbacteria bacterium RIFCSPLOWO2_12_FULL_46_17]